MNKDNFGKGESPRYSTSGGNGVCMMSSSWRDGQRPSFINFISSCLQANSFRLNTVQIAPDFIFNCGGVSVAFIFVTEWDCDRVATIYSRVKKLKEQFANMYVIVSLPSKEKNDSFVRSYFDYEMEFGRPAFIPVLNQEMGFEKIVKITHARGVCKQQDVVTKITIERERAVQTTDVYLKVLTSIPGIDSHDANTLYMGIGSIEAISQSSKDNILANTDLSDDKAETIIKFFRDPTYYLSPKIISQT